jgi:hypothetical protein
MIRIVRQALSLFEALYRPDTNAALAVVGLYGAFSKNKDVIKLYFAFLALSCLTVRFDALQYRPGTLRRPHGTDCTRLR